MHKYGRNYTDGMQPNPCYYKLHTVEKFFSHSFRSTARHNSNSCNVIMNTVCVCVGECLLDECANKLKIRFVSVFRERGRACAKYSPL